jgi:peptidoglycan/LPS O-acetylase OafA/YrhL
MIPQQIAGAALLIATLLFSPNIADVLSGPFGNWLGKLSFPLYLIHTLVMMSVTSYGFTWAHSHWPASNLPYAIAAATTICVSLLLALPLMRLDIWWVGITSSAAQMLKNAVISRMRTRDESEPNTIV